MKIPVYIYDNCLHAYFFTEEELSPFQAEKRKSVISPSKKVPISLD